MFIVAPAPTPEVERWFRTQDIRVSEIGLGDEHRPRAPIGTPEGHHVVWARID